MATNKTYWKGIEELEKNPSFVNNSKNEFSELLPVDEFLNKEEVKTEGTNRRDFLKFLGFSVTAATLAACEAPVTRSIPFLNKPDNLTPGIPNYFASTYYDGFDYASILVKTREGRPIFIDGNKNSTYTKGSANARINSSVLGLYDSKRAKGPAKKVKGSWAKNISWSEVINPITKDLKSVASRQGNIVILSNTIISPSSKEVVNNFIASYSALGAKVKHVTYDAISASGILDANNEVFGVRALPKYSFEKAKVIVSFGADFLGTWLDSVAYTKDYASTRKPENGWMSKHYQFESLLSLTGSNADVRGALKPSDLNNAVAYVYSKVSGDSVSASVPANVKAKLDKAIQDLSANKGSSLVVSGSNDKNIQVLVAAINNALNNYGSTLDLNQPVYTRQGNDAEFVALTKEMNGGKVDAILIIDSNPVYTSPASLKFTEGLAKVDLKVYFGDRLDETGVLCDYLTPSHHYLESWNDFNPAKGIYSLQQPTIPKLFNTVQWQEVVSELAGQNINYAEFVESNFKTTVLNSSSKADWNAALQVGNISNAISSSSVVANFGSALSTAKSKFKLQSGKFELELYTKVGLGNGNQALNPWLHELPDPISKMTYDNYVTMAASDAMEVLGVEDTNDNRRDYLYIGQDYPAKVVKLTVGNVSYDLPLVAQPGQAKGTIGVALGYGRKGTELFTRKEWLGDLFDAENNNNNTIGKNVFSVTNVSNSISNIVVSNVSVELVSGKSYPMATTQTHNTMMGRKLVNETTLAQYVAQKGKAKEHGGYNEQLMILDSYGVPNKPNELDLWAEHPIELVHRWGLSIDLNTCIGCGACVTACHLENNVPAVGKDEVRRSREMHWMRIDRYYSSVKAEKDYHDLNGRQDYLDAEVSADEPTVAFQPVMCQHCNHAPCETVCPVAATTHSDEGLNQMTYNRCVGTRYCANNCPYKVRRFNWFQYDSLNIPAFPDFAKVNAAQDDLGRMVLNPDVVVRSRGVMEKCSMCVQRIQAGKLDAKKKGEKVQDGAIQTACSSACPTNAISFGDLNDPQHAINKEKEQERAYFLLEEVGAQPNVYYQTKVRHI
jgi:MoCo/4Fe-4S cofactor protein with predicted Tat translocation signal